MVIGDVSFHPSNSLKEVTAYKKAKPDAQKNKTATTTTNNPTHKSENNAQGGSDNLNHLQTAPEFTHALEMTNALQQPAQKQNRSRNELICTP